MCFSGNKKNILCLATQYGCLHFPHLEITIQTKWNAAVAFCIGIFVDDAETCFISLLVLPINHDASVAVRVIYDDFLHLIGKIQQPDSHWDERDADNKERGQDSPRC